MDKPLTSRSLESSRKARWSPATIDQDREAVGDMGPCRVAANPVLVEGGQFPIEKIR